MNNQDILNNAPKGATHYAPKMNYISGDSNGKWFRYDPNGLNGLCWFEANDYKFSYVDDFRALTDIARIVELEEFIRRQRYNIKQNEGDATQKNIDRLLDGTK